MKLPFSFLKKNNRSNSFSQTIKLNKAKGGVIYWSKPSLVSVFFSIAATLLILIAIVSVSIPLFPKVVYSIFPGLSSSLAEILVRPPTTFGDILKESGEKEAETYQPPIDKSLPEIDMIKIPKIGVDTEIIEESPEDYELALRKGVWRVPDFGTPFSRDYPTILVAHRFGYLEWSNQYRRENSFYNLPKLEVGDQLEIIWDQRSYKYEIIEEKESEQITNYTADLILYTCKYLKSDDRIFLYARLLEY